jgi:hypothetical protein
MRAKRKAVHKFHYERQAKCPFGIVPSPFRSEGGGLSQGFGSTSVRMLSLIGIRIKTMAMSLPGPKIQLK